MPFGISNLLLFVYKNVPQWLPIILIALANDVHSNPGPQFQNNFFNFMSWNLNSLAKEKFQRIRLIEAHNSFFNYDLISICETSLNNSVELPELNEYIFVPVNNPANTKRGGVGLFYKNSLPIVVRNDLPFDESIVVELKFGRKKILEIENLITSLGLSQIISEPTNFEPNKNPSCIDIIITDQSNLVLDCGTRASLDSYCHHQIIYCKVNFRIPPPPPFERKIWHFKRANTVAIKKSMTGFPEHQHLNINTDPNWQVKTFTDILLNIMSNFIPNETKRFSPRDPPWIT